jgi:signal transduction histidine kinase
MVVTSPDIEELKRAGERIASARGPLARREDRARPRQSRYGYWAARGSVRGMGLSVCCGSIIEAHGGRVWAMSNLPRGAAFQFTLPQQRKIAS